MGMYDMPEGRTWCGILRCCREQDHAGTCEVDITELTVPELDAIRRSAEED